MQICHEIRDSTPEVGVGIFAKESVPVGTLIWKFIEGENVIIYDKKSAEDHLSRYQTLKEAQRWLDIAYGANGMLCVITDVGRNMNHSPTPNCKTTSNGDVYSIKNIAIGEELYEDYASFGKLLCIYEKSVFNIFIIYM